MLMTTPIEHAPAVMRTKRAAVLLDNSSLYRALVQTELSHTRLDYRRLLRSLSEGYDLTAAFFYCAEFGRDVDRRERFYQSLESWGYTLRRISLSGHRSHRTNAAFDRILSSSAHSHLVWDVRGLIDREKVDRLVLVAGDAEYASIVDLVGNQGIDVEVVFLGSACSHELRRRAKTFRELDITKFVRTS